MSILYSVFIYMRLMQHRMIWQSQAFCLMFGVRIVHHSEHWSHRCRPVRNQQVTRSLEHPGGTLCQDGKFDLILCNDAWRRKMSQPLTMWCVPKHQVAELRACGFTGFPIVFLRTACTSQIFTGPC